MGTHGTISCRTLNGYENTCAATNHRNDLPMSQVPIGWVGTGVMGLSMCGHLLQAGHPARIYNRTPEKARALVERGAVLRDLAGDVCAGSRVVFTMLGLPADVREVYLGAEGLIARAEPDTIFVDMTTSEPSLAREIAAAARSRGLASIDAPVSGGDVGAREARLSIMCGGDESAFRQVEGLLALMGKNIVYQGAAGSGQHAKCCNQIVVAGTMIGVCESLLYAAASGLDSETMLRSISGGAAACWTLDNLAPRMLRRDFDPGFYVEHFIKDMGIVLKEAEAMNLALPGLALVRELYKSVRAHGGAKLGTQSLLLALERMAGKNP